MQYISSEGLLIDTVKNEARILGVTNTVSSNSVAFLGTNNNTSLSSVSFGGANNTLTDNAIVIGGANNFVENALSFSSTNSKISSDSIDFNSNNIESINGSVSFRSDSTKLTASIGFQNSNDILNNNSIAFLSKNNNLNSSVLINGNNNILSLSSVNILTSNSNSNTNSVLFNSLSTNASLSAIGINANFSTIQNTSVGLNSLSGNITNKSIDIIGSNNSVNQNSVSINSDSSSVSNNSLNIRDINNIVSNNSFSIGSSSSNINNSSEGVFVNRTTLNNNSFAVGGSANNVNINSFGLNSLSSNISNNSFAIGGSANNVSINSFGINLTGSTISNNSEAFYTDRTTLNNNSFAIGGSENNINVNSFGINLTGSTISNNSEAFYTDKTTLNNNSFAIGGSANNININSIGINSVSSNVFNNSVSLYTNTNTVNLSSFAIGGINNNVNTNSIAINAVSSNVFNNSEAFYTDRTTLNNNSFAIGGSANNINTSSIAINAVSSNVSNNSVGFYTDRTTLNNSSFAIGGSANNINTNSLGINALSSNISNNSVGFYTNRSTLSLSSLGFNLSGSTISTNSLGVNVLNSNITNNSLGINSNSSNLHLSSLGLNTFNSTVSSSFVYNTVNVQALSSLVLNTTNSGVSSSVVIFGNSNTANNNSLVIEGDNNVVDNNSVILQSNTTNLSGNVFSTLTNSTTGRNNASIFNASNATVSSNAVLINGNNNIITNNSISIQGSSNTINLSSVGLATDNSRIINDSTSINTFNSTVSTKSLSLNTDSSTLIDRGIAINTFNSNVSTGSISLNTRGSTLQLSAVDILGNTNTVNNKGFAVNTSNSTVQNDGISFNTINSVVSGNSVVLGGNTNRSTDNSFVVNSSGSNAFTGSIIIGGRANTANLSAASINSLNTTIVGANSLILGGSGHNLNSTNSVYIGGENNNAANTPFGSTIGNNSILIGGRNNRVGSTGVIIGGNNNIASNNSFIIGGSANNASNFDNVVIIGRNDVIPSRGNVIYLPEIIALGNLTIQGNVSSSGGQTFVSTLTGSASSFRLNNLIYDIETLTVDQNFGPGTRDAARFSFSGNPRLSVNSQGVAINTFDRVTNQALTIAGNLSATDDVRIGGSIILNNDTTLYRSAADTLKTDDNLIVGTLATGSTDNIVTRDGNNTLQTRQVNPRVWSTATTFASSTNTFVTNRILKAANTNDGITNSQVFDNGTNVGVGNDIPNEKLTVSGSISSTNAIKLAVGTTQDNGIQFGTDTNLFRSAADTLQTSDNFVVGTLAINTNSDSTIVENSGKLEKRTINTRVWDTSAPYVSATSANSFTTNTILKAANGAGITNSIVTDNGTNVGISATTPNEKLTVSGNISGTNALILSPGTTQSNGIQFGTDTNLYRSAADTLQTDDELSITNAGGKDTLRITSTGTDTGITIGGDTNIYRSAANTLQTDDNLNIGTLGSGSTNTVITHSSNTLQQRTINSRVWDTNAPYVSATTNNSFTTNQVLKAGNSSGITNSIITDTGTNVGIGVTNPTQRLHIAGAISLSSNPGNFTAHITNYQGDQLILTPDSSDWNTSLRLNRATSAAYILANGYYPFYANSSGFVGINTANPSNQLDVNGTIRSRITSGTVLLGGGETKAAGTGTPSADGFRISYDGNLFGSAQDGLLIEKTDANGTTPDGGILFANTGLDGVSAVALSIKGSGNIGIGILNPTEKLTVVGGVSASQRMINAGMDCKGQMIFDSGTTVDNGIRFGSDVSLYRSAADTLRTDDSLIVGTLSPSTANAVVTHVAGQLQQRTINSRVWDTNATFLSGSGTFTTNYLPKATGSTSLDDSQIFDNGTGVGIGTATLGSNARLTVQGTVSASNLNIVSNGAITFGTDVNLYRSGNDTLRTDDQLHVNNMPTNNSSNNVIVNSSNILNTRTINSRVWDTAATFLSGSPTNNTLLKALGTNAVTNSNITEDVNNVIILAGSSSHFKNVNSDIRIYNGADNSFRLHHSSASVLRFIYNDGSTPLLEINGTTSMTAVTPFLAPRLIANGAGGTPADLTSTTHLLQIGSSGNILVCNGSSIQSRSGSTAGSLNLNVNGGGVNIGNSTSMVGCNGSFYISNTNTVALSSGVYPFQIGSNDTVANMVMDTSRIQARSNGAVSTLRLNPLGGNIETSASTIITMGSTIGEKIRLWSSSYGLGVGSSDFRLFSGDRFTFRDAAYGGAVLANITGVGEIRARQTIRAGLTVDASTLADVYQPGEHLVYAYGGTATTHTYICGRSVSDSSRSIYCAMDILDTDGIGTGTVTGEYFSVTGQGFVRAKSGTITVVSDIRRKQDITDANSQWNDIKNIKLVNFRYKSDVIKDPTTPKMLGVIAQQVEQISPELVYEDFHSPFIEGTPEKSVKLSIIYLKAVKALQEAMARIETLEAKVQALEK